MDYQKNGLGGRELWKKPSNDAVSEAAHHNMSVNEICRNVEEADKVKKFQNALTNKVRSPYNRFSSRMIKELVFNQRMDFNDATKAIGDQWK